MNIELKRPIVSGLFLGCLSATVLAGAPILAGSWSEETPIPTPRASAVAGAIEGKLYVAGGLADLEWTVGELPIVPTVEVYDPRTRKWTPGPSMLTGRSRAVGAVLDGKLYVVGGLSADRRFLDSLEEYDPRTGAWTARAPLHVRPNAGACSAAADGTMLYVVCVCQIFAYEPVSDRWTSVRDEGCVDDFPLRGGFALAALDRKLYLAGGAWPGFGTVGALDAYDTLTDSFTSLAPMPTPRSLAHAGLLDGKLLVVGGRDEMGAVHGTLDEYDPRSDTWTRGPDIPTPRLGAASGVVNGKLFVVGGVYTTDTGQPTDELAPVVEAYDPASDEQVCICHFPSGDLARARTICIDAAAAEAHIREHGDTPVACGLGRSGRSLAVRPQLQ